MLNLNNSEFLSQEQIRKIAPSVFTAQGAETTSEKYAHIPTNRILEDMQTLGWGVVDAKEVKARKQIGFQKHLIVFRNNDIVINGSDGDTVFLHSLLKLNKDLNNRLVEFPH